MYANVKKRTFVVKKDKSGQNAYQCAKNNKDFRIVVTPRGPGILSPGLAVGYSLSKI